MVTMDEVVDEVVTKVEVAVEEEVEEADTETTAIVADTIQHKGRTVTVIVTTQAVRFSLHPLLHSDRDIVSATDII